MSYRCVMLMHALTVWEGVGPVRCREPETKVEPLASTSSEAKPSSVLTGRSVQEGRPPSPSPVLQVAVPEAATALQAASAPMAAETSTPPPAVATINTLPPLKGTAAQAAGATANLSTKVIIDEVADLPAGTAPLQTAASPAAAAAAEDTAASPRVSSFFEHAVSHQFSRALHGHVSAMQGAKHLRCSTGGGRTQLAGGLRRKACNRQGTNRAAPGRGDPPPRAAPCQDQQPAGGRGGEAAFAWPLPIPCRSSRLSQQGAACTHRGPPQSLLPSHLRLPTHMVLWRASSAWLCLCGCGSSTMWRS